MEPQHRDQAESGEVPAHEKQEDANRSTVLAVKQRLMVRKVVWVRRRRRVLSLKTRKRRKLS